MSLVFLLFYSAFSVYLLAVFSLMSSAEFAPCSLPADLKLAPSVADLIVLRPYLSPSLLPLSAVCPCKLFHLGKFCLPSSAFLLGGHLGFKIGQVSLIGAVQLRHLDTNLGQLEPSPHPVGVLTVLTEAFSYCACAFHESLPLTWKVLLGVYTCW